MSDSRGGVDSLYCIYPLFFVLVCITYALLTVFGCSGVWILVVGVLTVPVFFSCLKIFSHFTFLPHLISYIYHALVKCHEQKD